MPSRRFLFLAAAAVALALAACTPETEADPRQSERFVQIYTVQPAEGGERIFTGLIAARVESNLGFRVAGKVVERLVDLGDAVKAGQPLMRIDRNDLDLAVAAREKAAAAAKAIAVQAVADEARYATLRKSGWSTQQKYESAKAALDSASAQLAAAEADAQVARNESGYSLLVADSDGTIVETLAEPGQVVARGQTVIRLAHAGRREAAVDLPETLRPKLGSQAQVSLYGDARRISAGLRQLSDAADPRTRTYEARYVLGDGDPPPLGATVKVAIATPRPDAATQAPIGAIYDDGGGPGVWVLDKQNSTVSLRRVEVARIGRDMAALAGGVEAGETIIATGGQLLHEGERVRIIGEKAAMQ
ncbi:efflux RND transporter periplasmic adaptor subunit [Methylocella silvestris]|uniref:Efflux transporter periplasmic adaptor subunit n=1 Tax=Methylocella silvestris TaxID=199596 RepID=A0A2J7TJ19_METSI|nr:efflux RND transporter periplasmic adaptor subunit [Methylocella silvestris]PNG26773.1 efflux transporter periplasmic adaptor subunit [Methylocella silvestris]